MIEIQNVSKSFGKQKVINDVSLTIDSGDMFCLLGPSGSGKTTLIKMIIGAQKLDAGKIIINSKEMPNLEIIKNIGFMPQNDALYLEISGKDNLQFFGSLYGLKGKKLLISVEKMLDFVTLSKDADKLVANYSGGMKKRLSLAIALLHDPDILILDEPTVGIDPVLRKTIWEEFEILRKKGKTLLISTHVMDEAERCKKAALLYQGFLIAKGSINYLKEKSGKNSIEELFFMTKEVKTSDKLNL